MGSPADAHTSFPHAIFLTCALVVLAFAALNIPFAKGTNGRWKPAQVFSIFWAVVAEIILLVTIFVPNWPSTGDSLQAESLLCVIIGAAVGWLLGMYVSPKDQPEQQIFQKVGTALTAVISGYTLKSLINLYQQNPAFVTAHELQIACFVITTLLTTAAVYNARAYDIDALDIFSVAQPPNMNATPLATLALKAGDTHLFCVQVSGAVNPSVAWSVTPVDPTKYTIDPQTGAFAATAASTCKVIATSIENPAISNGVDVTIT
jgi:hypothetical protein